MALPVVIAFVIIAVVSSRRWSKSTKGALVAGAVVLGLGTLAIDREGPHRALAHMLSGTLYLGGAACLLGARLGVGAASSAIKSNCPFCGLEFSFEEDEEGKSRSCGGCGNIHPTSADRESLAKYAHDTLALIRVAEGGAPHGDGEDGASGSGVRVGSGAGSDERTNVGKDG